MPVRNNSTDDIMDTSDGCVSSKTKLKDNDQGLMGPPNGILDEPEPFNDDGSQPATQPLNDSQQSEADDQYSMTEDDQPWGILYPYRPNWRHVELHANEITVGRSNGNSHAVTEEESGNRFFVSISKIHFIIRKTKDGIRIEDKSSNGTMVNGIVVGKNKSTVLDHHAIISIAKEKTYVFMYTARAYMAEYPSELRKKYVVSRELGTGACGTVRLGFHRDIDNHRYPVAIKIISKKVILSQNVGSDAALNEVKILRAVNHPSVIRMEDVVDTESHLFIILELAVGGELFDKIIQKTKFNEREAKLHFYQIVSGIKYLHSCKIAHRDLKPENILLCSDDDSNPIVKITDMGLSKLVGVDTVCKTFCGTPQYLAPEVLMSRARGNGTYDFKVDMWSLGVILYILLSGCPPFDPARKDKPLVKQICHGDYKFPSSKWSEISESAMDLVRKLMTVDSKKRLSAEQALQHPWLDDAATIERVHKLWALQRQQLRQQDASPNPEDQVDEGGRKREAVDNNSNGCTVETGLTDSVSRAPKRIRVDLQIEGDTAIEATNGNAD